MSRKFKSKAAVADHIEECLPRGSIPDFILTEVESMFERGERSFNPLEARAKYIQAVGGEGHDQHYLELLIAGEEASFSESQSDVIEIIHEKYLKLPLEIGEKRYEATFYARVKATFLDLALTRYLELGGIPGVVRHDLHVLLSSFGIVGSESRARAQRALLLYEGISIAQVAKKAKVDQSDLTQWLKARHVIDPYAKGRPANCVPKPRPAVKPRQ